LKDGKVLYHKGKELKHGEADGNEEAEGYFTALERTKRSVS
jgi:hypothetical protein